MLDPTDDGPHGALPALDVERPDEVRTATFSLG